MARSSDRWFPPASKPRPVEGGIKAHSKRGAIGQTWWSTRFITVLEDLGVGTRLQRGRTYARKGQVVTMSIEPGAVNAVVQGSRPQPYRVRIGLTAFGKAEWMSVSQALASSAWYAARLLSGEMPEDIEEVFKSVGLSLFPTQVSDLSMDCSCPDWSVPCKHLAAVFYLLAESFDADPFGVLAWRGRTRDELMAALSALRTGTDRAVTSSEEPAGGAIALSECMTSYFSAPVPITRSSPVVTAPDTLLDQLPSVDVTVLGADLPTTLRPIYRALGDDGDTSAP